MSTRETFWTILCRYARYYYLVLIAVTTLMVLNLFPLVFAEPGTESYVLSIVSMAFFTLTAACILGLLWMCNRT